MSLLGNIRFYILVFSFTLSSAAYFYLADIYTDPGLFITHLTQTYALTAAFYLYLALLIGPLVYIVRNLPFKASVLKARRAIGVSAFYFALLHVKFAFFDELGGFSSLPNLPLNTLIAITLSTSALLILSLMAATSFDFMIKKLTFNRWKRLHRLIYLVGIFILVHAFLIGSHFQDIYQGVIPKIALVLLVPLFILEANRFDYYLQKKLLLPSWFRVILASVILGIMYLLVQFIIRI